VASINKQKSGVPLFEVLHFFVPPVFFVPVIIKISLAFLIYLSNYMTTPIVAQLGVLIGMKASSSCL
jgi:hypothetical protein